jgi:uncharacterized protein (DUF2236 family)
MRIPGSADLTAAVRLMLPSGRAFPIHDPAPDPGLFGPGSVTWRVMAEPVLMLGAGRALLMQAGHPLVAEGAIEHSTYATDPYGRLERTIDWVSTVCFGTTAEARRACRHVNRLHGAVEGRLKRAHGTAAVRGGSAYSGRDPQLLTWVHATFVDTMLVTHDAFVGGLTEADADRFVREWDAVAALMGVPPATLWTSRAALREYVARQFEEAAGPAIPGAGSRLVARTVLRPPVSSAVMRPGWVAITFATVGLLPPALRRAYGIRWTPAHDAAHAGLALSLRTGRIAVPRRFKVSGLHDQAVARVEGRLEARKGAA